MQAFRWKAREELPERTNPLDDLPGDVRARLWKRPQPNWFPPMLATLVHHAFSREGWLFEPKLDGERCLVFRQAGALHLFSRNHQLLNLKYPDLVAYYRDACKKSWEGVLAKNGDSVYFSKRSHDWLKSKCVRRAHWVRRFAGYFGRGKLAYAGKVGTGYDRATRSHLSEQLRRLETNASPFPRIANRQETRRSGVREMSQLERKQRWL